MSVDFNRVPTNDSEVHEYFKAMYKDELTVANMWGIYRCKRKEGETVIDALEHAAQTYMEVVK